MDRQDYIHGVWKHVFSLSPIPERDELSRLIGKKLIDDNENLWIELGALKTIVFEMTGSTAAIDSIGRRNGKSKPYASGKKSLVAAMSYSQLHYQNDTPSNGSEALDAVYGTKRFSVELLSAPDKAFGTLMDCIRFALKEEKWELERGIEQISCALEGDLDSLAGAQFTSATSSDSQKLHSRGIAPSDGYMIGSTSCSSLLHNSKSAAIHSRSSSSRGAMDLDQPDYSERDGVRLCLLCSAVIDPVGHNADTRISVCTSCNSGENNRAKGKLKCSKGKEQLRNSTGDPAAVHSSADTAVRHKHSTESTVRASSSSNSSHINSNSSGGGDSSHHYSNQSPNSNNSSPRSGAGTSKFRNRLNSARHELHFLDEF